ncbi:DUF1636 family protein [Tropicimonas marinistellae]|uniref:DUF1636 family protein n=1 Tax=Tropicimonas marinistellae TaxID=1739787 RepID=UPI000835599A|nr:DUF1636 domain-containing protein [Tropicimonas marinistellae]
MTTITICTTCRTGKDRETKLGTPAGEAFLQRAQSAAASEPGLSVRGVACLMGCEHGCNAAITATGKMTYVLGRFDGTNEDAEALAGYARLYAESDTGSVPYRQWPTGVKGHFVARVPPVD